MGAACDPLFVKIQTVEQLPSEQINMKIHAYLHEPVPNQTLLSGFCSDDQVIASPKEWQELKASLSHLGSDPIEEMTIELPDDRVSRLFSNSQAVEDHSESEDDTPRALQYRLFLHEDHMGIRRCLGGLYEPDGRQQSTIDRSLSTLYGPEFTGLVRHFSMGVTIQSD